MKIHKIGTQCINFIQYYIILLNELLFMLLLRKKFNNYLSNNLFDFSTIFTNTIGHQSYMSKKRIPNYFIELRPLTGKDCNFFQKPIVHFTSSGIFLYNTKVLYRRNRKSAFSAACMFRANASAQCNFDVFHDGKLRRTPLTSKYREFNRISIQYNRFLILVCIRYTSFLVICVMCDENYFRWLNTFFSNVHKWWISTQSWGILMFFDEVVCVENSYSYFFMKIELNVAIIGTKCMF